MFCPGIFFYSFRFNCFYHQGINFFCHIFNVWESPFHLLSSVGEACSHVSCSIFFFFIFRSLFVFALLILFPLSVFEKFYWFPFPFHVFIYLLMRFIQFLKDLSLIHKGYFKVFYLGFSYVTVPTMLWSLSSSGDILSWLLLIVFCTGVYVFGFEKITILGAKIWSFLCWWVFGFLVSICLSFS